MVKVCNIRLLKDAAVLAERKATTASLDLKQFNLFYGFNGSGKSTLSRVFTALQSGEVQHRLPSNCTFEIEMSDGSRLNYPKSFAGHEKRFCVFNGDFIERNLRWDTGHATPVFYIGADQADAAQQLKELEATLPAAKQKLVGESKVAREREKAFAVFKKLTAGNIRERLRQVARYEATQFMSDVEKLGATAADVLSDDVLDAAIATCARSEPPAKVDPVGIPAEAIFDAIRSASELVPKSIGSIVVDGLAAHPTMVPWAQHGHEYHVSHNLESCLYCGSHIPGERIALLTAAFDDQLSAFVTDLNTSINAANGCAEALNIAKAAVPAAASLSAEFQPPFEAAAGKLTTALDDVTPLLLSALKSLRARQRTPTTAVTPNLPGIEDVKQRVQALSDSCAAVNDICKQHSDMVDTFVDHQTKAREDIRRHFVAKTASEYAKHVKEVEEGVGNEKAAEAAISKINEGVSELRAKVQQHGPAANKINLLVKSYLGHDELTIVAVEDGYELHRHGSLVTGAPSEGEKTAIALCYFLSTLEADDRKIKDLIVVIDDPVSSLDTKAMNYACSLVRNRLSGAAQLIVLTHNQQCMNEFKKHWKGWARGEPDKVKARLKFIDVTVPASTMLRTANIIDLPAHLREYESEYHYLFEKVLRFEEAAEGHFDYAFMMPNVLRRVLEIFLAFKVPRSGNISDKLKTLCERHKDLDLHRLNALERLTQVESHSDNLDDLISQSAMTVEESRDANAALLHLMKTVDGDHHADLEKYCKA